MKKRIVVIEDDETIREVLQLILERAGYSVDQYKDGKSIFAGNINGDLFIIDRRLPGADGLDICRHIRSQPNAAQVPIIVLSATPGLHNIIHDAGASEFIEKPFSSSSLIATIKKWLK